tara:strand:+ start:122 stop:745 length:624 start_codon:yes stop_codon:yes gene_type:complete
MAYHKQIFPDKRTGRRGGLAKYNADLDAYVSDRIQSSQTEFYEQEAFEVTEISKDVYGGVLGTFINDNTQQIKGNTVLPLKPNITQIPLIGEHISVIEFNGQHYYTDIINKLNSPNENALAGTSDYDELKKYGDTFTRNNTIKHIDISEGDIVFNSLPFTTGSKSFSTELPNLTSLLLINIPSLFIRTFFPPTLCPSSVVDASSDTK